MFTEEQPTITASRKGRSADLHARRNECLVDRYFFYGQFHNELRYETIISRLSDEFFISTVTIPEVITSHIDQLQQLKKEKPARGWFAKKWPHLKW